MASAFEIGNIHCEPGEVAYGTLPTVYGRDGFKVEVPLIVVNGVEDGPIIWLGSTVHGDEIPGIEVIRRLVHEELDPQELRGTVIACPVQHPVAYHASDRLTPSDGKNINRVFPGNPKGSWTDRFAYALFHDGIARADVVLDYHSNAADAVNFNIVRVGREGEAWEEQWPIARAFGFPIGTSEIGAGGPDSPLSGMLHDACLANDMPALTVEFSGGYTWEEPSVRGGVTGTLNVMKYLDMIDGEIEPQTEVMVIDEPLTNRHHISCDKGGYVVPLVPLGERVNEGDPVVRIYDIYGREVETITSPIDGWVITYPRKGNHTVASGQSVFFVFAP